MSAVNPRLGGAPQAVAACCASLAPFWASAFQSQGQNQLECLPAEAEAEVFLVLGVLESGRGEVGTAQRGPPPRDPEISLEMGT